MMRAVRRMWLSVILLCVPGIALAQGPQSQDALVKKGAAVFAANCTGYCHAQDGKQGSSAPALASRGLDGEYIQKVVMYGIEGTPMTAWGQRIPKDDSTAVIAYVKSLNGLIATGPRPGRPVLPANAEHGHDLFFDTPGELARCSICHQMNGTGIPVTRPIATIPADVAGLRALATPKVVTATVNGRTFPALVVSQVREQVKLYDMTTVPPVLIGAPPAAVKLGDPAAWKHSSLLEPYSDADLSSILEYLRAMQAH